MAGNTDYLPTREAELLTFCTSFDEQINNTPEAFGLTAAQAANYSTLFTAFAAKYQAANDGTTRTPAVIAAKNTAKEALITDTRKLAKLIQATPSVTDEQRAGLGLHIPSDERIPVPVPSTKPVIEIKDIDGHLVYLRLHDNTDTANRKPEGVAGAVLYTFVGESAPTSVDDWKWNGTTSKLNATIEFDPDLEPGTKVWITAAWANAKLETGQACPAVSLVINYGGVQQAS